MGETLCQMHLGFEKDTGRPLFQSLDLSPLTIRGEMPDEKWIHTASEKRLILLSPPDRADL
jgi:hypothetical protein